MQVILESNPTGPLKVIPRLPHARLAKLEGLNGIGKTLTTRILQLCTGQMPYGPGSAAWSSLRDGLGAFRIEVTELHGAKQIVWEGNSSLWGEDGVAAPQTSWFRRISIDGKEATIEDVRRLITVYRLAGDERLADTFASEADRSAYVVRRWRQRYAAEEDSPLTRLEALVDSARKVLPQWTSRDLSELTRSCSRAESELVSGERRQKELQERLKGLEEALGLNERLATMQRRAPELREQLQAIDDAIVVAQKERAKAQANERRLAQRFGRAEQQEKELRNARRTLNRNRASLESAVSRASAAAAELDTEPNLRVAIALARDVEGELGRYESRLASANANNTVQVLLGTFVQELDEAETDGLGAEIAIEDTDQDLELTISEARQGMDRRRTTLGASPTPPDLLDIEREHEVASLRLRHLRQLITVLRQVQRYRRLVGDNEERVSRALRRGAGGKAAADLQEASEHRRSCDSELLELAERRAAIAQRLGLDGDAGGEAAVRAQLSDALAELGITDAELGDSLRVARSEIEQLFDKNQLTRKRSEELRRDLTRARHEVNQAIARMASDDSLSWLRDAVGASSGPTRATSTEPAAIIDNARSMTAELIDRLGAHRSQLGAVERALLGISRQLRGEAAESAEYLEEVRSWLEHRFAGQFNHKRVRQELMPQADDDVRIDLAQQQVYWTESGAETFRPLEAFSSGEQAFAYTRARLAMLDNDSVTASNRLIVLDEFGAFIAHDRLQGLVNYLKERSEQHRHDQVLVILPLSQDYAQLAQSAIGDERSRYERWANEVDANRYIVQVLAQ